MESLVDLRKIEEYHGESAHLPGFAVIQRQHDDLVLLDIKDDYIDT